MAAFLSQLKLTAEVAEVSVPFVRSTWARCNLATPPNISLNEARKLQTKIVQVIKEAKLHSELPDSNGQLLWCMPHRTPEKRNRIKAVVMRKEFCSLHAAKLAIPPK